MKVMVKRVIAAGVVGMVSVGVVALAMVPMACGPGWTVSYPETLPTGVIAARDAGGNIEGLGFLNDSRGLVVWAWNRSAKARAPRYTLMRMDPQTPDALCRFHVSAMPISVIHPAGPVALFGWHRLQIWNLAGQPTRPVIDRAENSYAGRCAFSPDGTVVTIGNDGLGLYDTRTGKRLWELGGAVGTPVFSHDGKTLAAFLSGPKQWVLAIWNVADGKLIRTMPPLAHENLAVMGLSASGKSIILREWHHAPRDSRWPSVLAGKPANSQPRSQTTRVLDALPSRAAPGPIVSTLVYEIATGKLLVKTDNRVRLCAGNTRLLAWPVGRDLHVYDLDTGQLERTIPGIDTPVVSGNLVAAIQRVDHYRQRDRKYGLWNVTTGRKVTTITLTEPGDHPCRLLSPDGRFLVLGRYVLLVLDTSAGKNILHIRPPIRGDAYRDYLRHATFSPDGRYLAFAINRYVGIVDMVRLTP